MCLRDLRIERLVSLRGFGGHDIAGRRRHSVGFKKIGLMFFFLYFDQKICLLLFMVVLDGVLVPIKYEACVVRVQTVISKESCVHTKSSPTIKIQNVILNDFLGLIMEACT